VCAFAGVAMLAVLLSIVSSAVATQHHPRGIFSPFADCPLSNPTVVVCMVASITDGEIVLGKKTVPIDRTITLQTGLVPAGGENFNEYVLAGAEDGKTLSKTALHIPGGLVGLGGVTSTTEASAMAELANPISAARLDLASFVLEEGVALRLPLKIKLSNPLLGSNCYIGSSTSPVVLNLTDGRTGPPAPNKPIKGSIGEIEGISEGQQELTAANRSLIVDNAFAVPAVNGCSQFYASLVSSDVGLPSPAGHNTAIMSSNLKLAFASEVKASE